MDSSMEELISINKKIVVGEILIFNFLGLFGNINLIYATLRKKDMRSKPGLLLTITTICHIVCLVSELFNAYFLATNTVIIRKNCIYFMIPYMFAISAQAVLALTMALDILGAVIFPAKYMRQSVGVYVFIACLPAAIYGFFIMAGGIFYTDDAVIPFCNPPLVLIPEISRIWSLSNVVINTAVVFVYVLIIVVVKIRGRNGVAREQQKVIRRLQVVALVFVFSWYITMLGVDIGALLPMKIRPFWQSNMVFFALICYTQTFYVCLWRSTEYRRLFCEQMGWLGIPCKWLAPKEEHTIDSRNRTMETSRFHGNNQVAVVAH